MTAPRRLRTRGMVRRPERDLEVLWQGHIPGGDWVDTPQFSEAGGDLIGSFETALDEIPLEEFRDADLVVTISRRPL